MMSVRGIFSGLMTNSQTLDNHSNFSPQLFKTSKCDHISLELSSRYFAKITFFQRNINRYSELLQAYSSLLLQTVVEYFCILKD